SVGGVASSRASNAFKLAGVTICKPRCETPFAIKRLFRSLTCPRVGTTTREGKSHFQVSGKTCSSQGKRTLSQVLPNEEPICNETDRFGSSGFLRGIR